jgi:hypothetical protein
MRHDWRTICPSTNAAHLVRGTELEVSIPAGFLSRFAIYSVRRMEWVSDPTLPAGGIWAHDVSYRVRDAATISDAEVKAGVRPKIVGEFKTLEEAEAFMLQRVEYRDDRGAPVNNFHGDH